MTSKKGKTFKEGMLFCVRPCKDSLTLALSQRERGFQGFPGDGFQAVQNSKL